MCGIAGLLSLDGHVEPRRVQVMMEALRHRGPDDEGYVFMDFSGANVEERRGTDTVPARAVGLASVDQAANGAFALGLGHRRLSIIDVSAAGHQPMHSEDRRLWLTYNGEIYNYLELRRELEAFGHAFSSNSDTEVILKAYQQWGLGCLSRFNGMWAFALADLRRRSLICARDRLGVKPLYYHFDGRTFAFGSEVRALLRLPWVKVAPNDRVLWDFLVLGAIDHTAETCFADVVAVEGGHYLEISFDGKFRDQPFWEFQASPLSTGPASEVRRRAPGRVRELLTDAVRLRLRSDVNVGFCLSGGLDSSSVVGIADRLLDEADRPQVGPRLSVFHAAFDDPGIDERPYVRTVLAQTRVAPHFVFPTGQELVQDYRRLLWHQEQPFGGPSVYAQYRVFGLARAAGVKVLLDGQAGDELFAGYHRYFGLQLTRFLAAGQLGQAKALLSAHGLGVSRHAGLQLALRHLPGKSARELLVHTSTEPSLIAPDFLAAFTHRADRIIREERACRSLGDMLARDLTHASLPRLLRFEDRNSMAFSLESRVPFADDLPLIEYVAGLPDSAKVWAGWSKYVLREAMHGLVPDPIRWRRRKLGFAVPEREWAAEARGSALWDVLAETPSQYIDRGQLERRLHPGSSTPIRTSVLWRLLEVSLWEQAVASGEFLGPPPAARLGQGEIRVAG
jgi:asparagine synthase (glutamine-hydrolysing)